MAEVAHQAVIHVPEPHMATHLQATSSGLHTQLAELRTAINHAQQLNFSQQLLYSEELIKVGVKAILQSTIWNHVSQYQIFQELDEELLAAQRAAQRGQLEPARGQTAHTATGQLMSAARQVGATLAQLVSASTTPDRYFLQKILCTKSIMTLI